MAATMRHRSVPNRLIDLLETYAGEWLTADELRDLYVEAFGLVEAGTLRKAVLRLTQRADEYGIEIRDRPLDDCGRIECRMPWRAYWESDLPPAC